MSTATERCVCVRLAADPVLDPDTYPDPDTLHSHQPPITTRQVDRTTMGNKPLHLSHARYRALEKLYRKHLIAEKVPPPSALGATSRDVRFHPHPSSIPPQFLLTDPHCSALTHTHCRVGCSRADRAK